MLDLFLRLIVINFVSNGLNQRQPQGNFFKTMSDHPKPMVGRHGRQFQLWPIQFIKSALTQLVSKVSLVSNNGREIQNKGLFCNVSPSALYQTSNLMLQPLRGALTPAGSSSPCGEPQPCRAGNLTQPRIMAEPLNNYSKEEISTFWGILYSITKIFDV